MQRNLIFSSNVIIADICGFCLASSHSLFFSNILLIFVWETTLPTSQPGSFDESSLLPLQAWPITALYLLKHNWFKDVHMKSTHQANRTQSRDLCPHYWRTGTLYLQLRSKEHSSLEWLVTIFAVARKEAVWKGVWQRKAEGEGEERQKDTSHGEII